MSHTISFLLSSCFGPHKPLPPYAAALGHTNPKVKEATLNWLSGEVSNEPLDTLKKLGPALLPHASKCAAQVRCSKGVIGCPIDGAQGAASGIFE